MAFCVAPSLPLSLSRPLPTCRRPRSASHSPRTHLRAVAASASTNPQPPPQSPWRTFESCELLLPPSPTSLIYFSGGFLAGLQPRLYSVFLSTLSQAANCAILTTPHTLTSDHYELSRTLATRFNTASNALFSQLGNELPAFFMSHSLGGKLCILMQVEERLKTKANIYLAFSNSNVERAVPEQARRFANLAVDRGREALKKVGKVTSDFGMQGVEEWGEQVLNRFENWEIVPDVEETWGKVRQYAEGVDHQPQDDLVIKFERDTICESLRLKQILGNAVYRELSGTHVTPLTPEVEDSMGTIADVVRAEMEDCVKVVAAFLKLHTEVLQT